MSVVDDIAPIIDDVYPLYLQVYSRSDQHFEKLTKDYFCGLGHRLGDKNRFFIWRQSGKIVAFGSCLLQGDTIHAEYLGLDYAVALDQHLYHYTFRDLISWGIANGYKWFHSSALNYDPKFHLRYRLDPIDLYVRHTSTICNSIFRRILPWLEPTRYHETLKKFDNYNELWAPTDSRGRPRAAAALSALTHGKDAILSAFANFGNKVSVTIGRVFGSKQLRPYDLGASFSLVLVATAILLAVDNYVDVPHLAFVYLMPIIFVAAKFGRVPALVALVLSSLCSAFFLYEPVFSFHIDRNEDVKELVCFCVTALLMSQFIGERTERILTRAQ